MPRTTRLLLGACACLAVAAIAWPAAAQDAPRKVAGQPASPAPAEDVVQAVESDDILLPGGNGLLAEPEVDAANIELWIFGQGGIAAAHKTIDQALAQDIDRFNRKYALTASQRKKLELAGRLDAKRFFDRVEDMKAEYRRSQGDWNQVGHTVLELQKLFGHPHSELFGDHSMLAKTLRTTLTAEQIARNDRNVYRTRVEWAAQLLDIRLKLSAEQHRRLVDLIVEETPPIRRYGSFDYDAIMFQMSRLPPEKLRAAIGEAQCRELAIRFEQARRLEGVLRSEGYLPPAAAAPGPTAAAPVAHHQELRR